MNPNMLFAAFIVIVAGILLASTSINPAIVGFAAGLALAIFFSVGPKSSKNKPLGISMERWNVMVKHKDFYKLVIAAVIMFVLVAVTAVLTFIYGLDSGVYVIILIVSLYLAYFYHWVRSHRH